MNTVLTYDEFINEGLISNTINRSKLNSKRLEETNDIVYDINEICDDAFYENHMSLFDDFYIFIENKYKKPIQKYKNIIISRTDDPDEIEEDAIEMFNSHDIDDKGLPPEFTNFEYGMTLDKIEDLYDMFGDGEIVFSYESNEGFKLTLNMGDDKLDISNAENLITMFINTLSSVIIQTISYE